MTDLPQDEADEIGRIAMAMLVLEVWTPGSLPEADEALFTTLHQRVQEIEAGTYNLLLSVLSLAANAVHILASQTELSEGHWLEQLERVNDGDRAEERPH